MSCFCITVTWNKIEQIKLFQISALIGLRQVSFYRLSFKEKLLK